MATKRTKKILAKYQPLQLGTVISGRSDLTEPDDYADKIVCHIQSVFFVHNEYLKLKETKLRLPFVAQ